MNSDKAQVEVSFHRHDGTKHYIAIACGEQKLEVALDDELLFELPPDPKRTVSQVLGLVSGALRQLDVVSTYVAPPAEEPPALEASDMSDTLKAELAAPARGRRK